MPLVADWARKSHTRQRQLAGQACYECPYGEGDNLPLMCAVMRWLPEGAGMRCTLEPWHLGERRRGRREATEVLCQAAAKAKEEENRGGKQQ